jgi:hypothetical protein
MNISSAYNMHWEVEEEYPKWQLNNYGIIRVDITHQFNAKFRIVAYTRVSELIQDELHRAITKKQINALGHGKGDHIGYHDDIFSIIHEVGTTSLEMEPWRVSNCAAMLPGYMRRIGHQSWENKVPEFAVFVPSPTDQYSVQFSSVPWEVFKRYWRKPIYLNRNFHDGKEVTASQAIEILDFDMTVLRKHKCFLADFSHLAIKRKREHSVEMSDWLMNNSRAFKFMSDGDTPFSNEAAESYFTMEWML